jgi:HK97 family phage major capsid protein
MTEKFEATEGGAALEAAGMLKQFVRDFRGFQDRVETKLRAQDDRLSEVDRKASASRRPALAAETPEDAPVRKALAAYLRHGEETALSSGLERKDLITSDEAHGGILVDAADETVATIKRAEGSLRAVANVVLVEGGVYETLVDQGDMATAWVSETDAATETAAGGIERVSIPLHELAAMPRASQRLLEDAAFDVAEWLAESAAATFARAESAAFVNGTGAAQPSGFLSYPQAPAATAVWGQIGYVLTGVPGGFDATDPSDSIVDLVYSLDAGYRANGAFVMNSATAGAVRKMKDVDGRFLWAERMCDSEPARLLGYPVVICEAMPDIGEGATAIAFGDFRAGYTIAERPEIRILRDPFSVKPHVQFYVSARVGGAVVDSRAIRLLKFAAA